MKQVAGRDGTPASVVGAEWTESNLLPQRDRVYSPAPGPPEPYLHSALKRGGGDRIRTCEHPGSEPGGLDRLHSLPYRKTHCMAGGHRTPDLRFWRPPLCQLSYCHAMRFHWYCKLLARVEGLEPSTCGIKIRCSEPLSYTPTDNDNLVRPAGLEPATPAFVARNSSN